MSPGNADAKSDPPQGRENRRLKIAGIVLMCIATPALAWLADAQQRLAVFVPVFLVAGNIFMIGLIIFLAGLRDIPLRTSVQARKGALVKLAGANLLLVIMGFVIHEDTGASRKVGEEWWWLYLLGLIVFVFLARTGVILFRRGWKYDAVSAEKVIKEDTRPPVVYIRSFKDDDKIILGKGFKRWVSSLNYMAAMSAEQELALIMNRVGPVVAIGKPGEELPELGASRLYVGDDKWQGTITDLMKQSRLVVVRAGATANLKWEIDQAVEFLPHRQLIFVSLGQDKDAQAFDEDVEQRFGRPETVKHPPPSILLKLLGVLMGGRKNHGKIIYFDEDSKPYAEHMRFEPSWSGLILSPIRPYWDALAVPFRHVFKQLDLPWHNRKSKNIAVFLALGFGMSGIHQFYIGNRRRGWFYLITFLSSFPFILGGMITPNSEWFLIVPAAFSISIPLILGWIDAVKFMRASQEDFQRRFVPHSHPEEGLEDWNKERPQILQ